MTQFPIHDLNTAPEGSRESLAEVKANWGFIPKLQGTLAENPVATKAYGYLFATIASEGVMDDTEQQIVYLTVSAFHGCEYCVSEHTMLADQLKVDAEVVAAVREARAIADPRLEALRVFTLGILETRGLAGDDAVDGFLDTGFSRAAVLEVLTIIAVKTISNYTNHLTHTPLEGVMADPAVRWADPQGRTPQRPEPARTAA